MASIINASSSGSGGIVQTADASGVLQLQSNGTVSLQVDASANVGIGTTNANGYKLAVGDGASNRGRIYLKGATGGNYPEINIDDTMNTSGKNYQVYSTGGVLKVSNQTDAAVAFVANNYGIGLGDNAAVDGTGIRFPATQSASTNANTLDDYEEGTFTPSITFGGNAVGLTYGSRLGRYTKVGNCVTFNLYVAMTNKGSSTGAFFISGLPFTSQSTTAGYNTLTLWTNNTNSNLSGVVQGYVNSGQSGVTFEYQSAGYYGAMGVLTNTQCNNSSDFMVGGMYYV